MHNMMRYDEAIYCYTRALAIDPENGAVLSLREAARAGLARQNTSEKTVSENT